MERTGNHSCNIPRIIYTKPSLCMSHNPNARLQRLSTQTSICARAHTHVHTHIHTCTQNVASWLLTPPAPHCISLSAHCSLPLGSNVNTPHLWVPLGDSVGLTHWALSMVPSSMVTMFIK